MVNDLLGHHRAHIASAGGVTDVTGATADKRNGLVSRHLKPLHKAQRHEVTDVQRIRRGVKADIEGRLAVIDQLSDLFLIRDLRDKSSCYEFLINSHYNPPFRRYGRYK